MKRQFGLVLSLQEMHYKDSKVGANICFLLKLSGKFFSYVF